jgi:mono/diheme cytochrome c family protein
VACHGAPEAGQAPGDEPALSGGRRIDLGLAGSVTAPNITPDPDTGIGRMTDVEIARALRHGIGRDGRALVPVMSTAGLSDHDIGAVVSYLRTREPVRAPHATREGLSFAGRTAMALGLQPHATTPYRPPVQVIADRSAAHGEYLARAVAACQACHTARHPLTGRPEGLPFGGGSVLQHAGREWVPPSLRGQASVLAGRSEPEFIDLFRRRQAVASSSPMPWREFGRMDDTELAALYRYLSSLSDPLASPQTSR